MEDFLNIDVELIRSELERRGIVNGEIVDEEKANKNSFIRQVERDIEKLGI